MTKAKNLLKILIDGLEKVGAKAEVCLIGSDYRAEQVRAWLDELGKDMHIIADDEISPRNIYVCSLDALSQFPGGCSN